MLHDALDYATFGFVTFVGLIVLYVGLSVLLDRRADRLDRAAWDEFTRHGSSEGRW
jgi:hypothetical protein